MKAVHRRVGVGAKTWMKAKLFSGAPDNQRQWLQYWPRIGHS
jgi:hypothetical protein